MSATAAICSNPGLRPNRAVAFWLLSMCAMVFVMVILGGLTRLTHSGLSIVEWKPVTGIFPPMNEADWQLLFDQYRQFPEYQKVNQGMSVDEFKGIFWLEFIHRLWGRAIGVVFLVPFLAFLVLKQIEWRMAPRLFLIFLLGGFQGFLGWWMVKSGLAHEPDVSQYRLTLHLGAAFLIFAVMEWVALGMLSSQPTQAGAGLRRLTSLAVALAAVTVLAGGLVAGTDAGFTYNTFPLMDGSLIPSEILFPLDPWWLSAFEDLATIQFQHRILALTTMGVALAAGWLAFSQNIAARAKRAFLLAGGMALVQVGLGIATLLLIVPVALGSAHQAGAMVLLGLLIWARHEIRAG
ncbi:MAG: COX15/CtaA family protein [Alphaproteobacteria bacterium]|nr:COX15/CtaA family protein [Alphaproteobacteria bacterium]